MRILMLNHNLAGRGSFLRCRHFAAWLVKSGHQVDLLTAADSPCLHWQERLDEGVRILLPPRWGKVGSHDGGYAPIDILCRLPTALRGYDLIHAFEHRPNVSIPALLSRLRGTPLVTDWSDWWTRGGITTPRRRFPLVDRWEAKWLEEGTKKISRRVTVVSQALWDRAQEIGIPVDRLDLLPSGSDHTRIHLRDKSECRFLLNLPPEGPVLGFVGFAFWDFEFLVEAFQRVLARFPSARLVVAGEDKDGQIEPIARQRLGARAAQVQLLGRFEPDQLEIPLGAADIQLLPLPDNLANRARWPIKFGDYLASGRPTVASRVGDTAAILEKEGAGVSVPPTPQGMSEGVLALLDRPDEMESMGVRARAVAEGRLSWESQTRKLEQVYERCLAQRT